MHRIKCDGLELKKEADEMFREIKKLDAKIGPREETILKSEKNGFLSGFELETKKRELATLQDERDQKQDRLDKLNKKLATYWDKDHKE